jgi:hypothetical protein
MAAGGSFTKFAGQKACKVGSIETAFCSFVFLAWLHIAKKLFIKCFLKFSIAKMHQNLRKKFHISLHMVQVAKYRRICVKNLLSYLGYSQIWLNLLVDHHHFGGFVTN